MRRLLSGIALGTLSLHAPVFAADLRLPVKAQPPVFHYDWTGFYVGAHTGYGAGSFGPEANPLPLQGVVFPHSLIGLIGGYQAGYNVELANRVVLGGEADITFTAPPDQPAVTPTPFNTTFDHFGTARGRIGYAFGPLLPYATAGLAWGRTRLTINDADGEAIDQKAHLQYGWAAGVGLEFAIGRNWSGKVEYETTALGARTFALDGQPPTTIGVDPRLHLFKMGLNYRLSDLSPWNDVTTSAMRQPSLPEATNWSVHGQTTFLTQGYPAFRAPYQGVNSLPSVASGRETWTTTAFLGWRLWQGGEFYFNPEIAQGFGIGHTTGLAGFSNGEAQKGGADYPKFRPERYYLRQTFGLGGEQEDVADAPNQLSGKRDIDRVTVILGRFAVGDFFDGNAYAKDPRADFMNWAMWSSAAYDFPADLPGFTRGAVVELNHKDWAIRAGLFEVPAAPNSDVLTFKTGGSLIEFEERHTIFDQPGKLRLGAFANRSNTGNYRDALGISAVDSTIDINTALVDTRQQRLKYGFYLNGEQQIAKDIGMFARASWNDGHTEILSFTDIDRSVSGGLSIKGSYWGRLNDTFGFGGAINALSNDKRDFLAAGGHGLIIGDGQLNYHKERILESYYALAVQRGLTFTADYQLVVNPAYNADRGPVSIFSGRLHGEF
jgi:high affinity Mn2+ porin